MVFRLSLFHFYIAMHTQSVFTNPLKGKFAAKFTMILVKILEMHTIFSWLFSLLKILHHKLAFSEFANIIER